MGTTAVVYYVGIVAEDWLKRFSYFGLAAAVLVGLASMLIVRRKAQKMTAKKSEPEPVNVGE